MLTMNQAAANLAPLLYNPNAPVIDSFAGSGISCPTSFRL